MTKIREVSRSASVVRRLSVAIDQRMKTNPAYAHASPAAAIGIDIGVLAEDASVTTMRAQWHLPAAWATARRRHLARVRYGALPRWKKRRVLQAKKASVSSPAITASLVRNIKRREGRLRARISSAPAANDGIPVSGSLVLGPGGKSFATPLCHIVRCSALAKRFYTKNGDIPPLGWGGN